jgi:hypothetical protein
VLRECPKCGFLQDSFLDLSACEVCGTEISFDFTEEPIKKEGKMIPEGKSSSFASFIKLPNALTGSQGEIAVGEKVTVLSEFAPPTSDKLKSPFIGLVKLANEEERTLGINWTTYYEIAKVLGRDTKDWIGSFITYLGMKKMGKGGMGHLWSGK